jgi:phosphatidylserine decarboxylase
MSPFNVHVNRIPISGKIFSLNYIKGKYLVAFDEKSSENNERTEIGIKTEDGKSMLFKQIAGFVARRIVCELAINNDVRRGEKFGMIKFGSRVDIIIDSGSEILIEKGQKVKAGITNIAKIK